MVAEVAKADALFRAGCYNCLKEALAIYQRNKVPQGAFDAALLIAIRVRELGIPAEQSTALAQSLALPTSGPLLTSVELITGELSGFDPVQRAAIQRGR